MTDEMLISMVKELFDSHLPPDTLDSGALPQKNASGEYDDDDLRAWFLERSKWSDEDRALRAKRLEYQEQVEKAIQQANPSLTASPVPDPKRIIIFERFQE
jgi:hypothetical protein